MIQDITTSITKTQWDESCWWRNTKFTTVMDCDSIGNLSWWLDKLLSCHLLHRFCS